MKNRILYDYIIPICFLLFYFLMGMMLGVATCQGNESQVCRDGKCPPVTERGCVSIVRITHKDASGIGYFTGTLIDWPNKYDLVLTCAHPFGQAGNTMVINIDGTRSWASILGINHELDLAILKIQKSNKRKIKIHKQAPPIGEKIAGVGFGWVGENYRWFYGNVITGNEDTFLFSGVAHDGDSGGPIMNSQGILVGIISTADASGTDGVRCDRILEFINKALRELKSEQIETSDPQSPPEDSAKPIEVEADSPGATLLNPLPWLPIVPVKSTIQQTTDSHEQQVHSETLAEEQEALSTGLGLLSNSNWLPLAVRGGKFAAAAAGITIGTGLTGGTGWAAWLAIQGAMRLYKRRKKRKRDQIAEATVLAAAPGGISAIKAADNFLGIARDDEEAKQLLQLSQLEGRNPVHDAIIGRFTFDTIELLLDQQPTGPAADALRKLRFQIESRFNEVAPVAVLKEEK